MSPKPINCRYFYGDYFRGKNVEECRLLARNPDNERPWRRKLCDTCPVPELIITSQCRHLEVEAIIQRKLLREQVEVTLAFCAKHLIELDDPHYCPQCAAEAPRA